MSRVRKPLLDRFRASSVERVAASLALLEAESPDEDALLEARRSLHTLSGEAYMLGLSSLAEFVRDIRDVLGTTPGPTQLSRARGGIELLSEWFEVELVEDEHARARLQKHQAHLDQLSNPDLTPAHAGTETETGPIVLVVDDSPIVRMLLTAQLEDASFEVRTANDGDQALDSIRAQRPALVLTDIEMPGMGGFELLRRLRDLDPKLPVVMLSGDRTDSDHAHATSLGAAGYLLKAHESQELLSTVRRLVRGRA